MAITIARTASINADGRSMTQKATVTGEEAANVSLTLPAAKAGTMTTKTSASVGLITTTSAHGLLTSDKCSVFWQDATTGAYKSRHDCSISAVTSTTLTTTTATGLGDDLPADGTTLTVGKVVARTIAIHGTGAGLQGFAVGSGARATVTVQEGATADSGDVLLHLHPDNGFGFAWLSGDVFPVVGLTGDFAAVAAANGDVSREATMQMVFVDA